ncbi:MAG: diguanylate cyclase, partial [Planctomycetes bacterium]|nr:diguanylate cyclase [Planctomycetota bacterium]
MSASPPDSRPDPRREVADISILPPELRPTLLEALKDGLHAVALFDSDDRLTYANHTFLSGWAVEAAGARSFDDLMRACHARGEGAIVATEDMDAWLRRAHERRRNGPEMRSFEVDLSDGRWFWVTERRLPEGWILLLGQDITGLKHSERTLQIARDAALEASLTDPLTQLPNRRKAMQDLDGLVGHPEGVSLALIDLDHFKRVNDTYGHAVGDALLRAFADRLRGLEMPCRTIARLSGDEFAVISPPGLGRDAFEDALRRIMATLTSPFRLLGHRVEVRVSIGAARAPDDGRTVEELLCAADMAMYHVKLSGRSAWCFHDAGMGARAREEAGLRADISGALAEGQFVPFYQPLVELGTGRLWGFELLARWHHPRLGLLTPDRFLPLLTTGGDLANLTSALLSQANLDIRDWPQGLRLAFNASGQQLTPDNLPVALERLARDQGLPLDRLELEITEAALLKDPSEARATVEIVRALGL